MKQGLVVNSPFHALRTHTSELIPLDSLAIDRPLQGIDTRPRIAARLIYTAAATALAIRHRSLDTIARHVEARRARIPRSPPAVGANTQTAAFLRLRPLLFTARDQCLMDSLTLQRFLAGGGVDSTWIIGIRTRPFAAHSWVQSGSTVLNDHHERVRRFQPILVV